MSALCGLFGEVAQQAGAEQQLAKMARTAVYKGESSADHVDRPAGILLSCQIAKVRLDEPQSAILVNEDGSLFMGWQGHVFNSPEVSAWLKSKGHTILSAHSCELLLHLYEEEGERGWRRADGQFAVAIWDRSRGKLVLGRDYLGVEPIYYSASPKGIVFATEIRELLEHPAVPRKANIAGISQYLTFLSVPAPVTLFAGIQKLPPGSVAVCARDGSVKIRKYWDLLDNPIPEREDEQYYVEQTRQLHFAAVKRRGLDGPVGALLSGGNDSSANVALMARFSSNPIHTFTLGLAETEGDGHYSDLKHAAVVANLAKTNHHPALLSNDEFLKTIPLTVEAMDDMVSEPSTVFLYHALRMAKDCGVRVVIAGEANDELCCGHGEMIRIRQKYYERWLPFMQTPALILRAAAAVAPLAFPQKREMLERAASGGVYFWNFEVCWSDEDKPEVLTARAWEQCREDTASTVVARYAKHFRTSEHARRDYLNYMIYVMMQDHYFGNLMLGKMGLLAAQAGVEVRCPYTEPAYAHFVYNVPASLKAKNGLVKYFFKKAIEGLLPDDIIYRPKQGFRTPVVELFKGVLGDWSKPILLESGLTHAGVLRRQHLEHLLDSHRKGERDYSNRLWTAMAINLWYDRWIRSN